MVRLMKAVAILALLITLGVLILAVGMVLFVPVVLGILFSHPRHAPWFSLVVVLVVLWGAAGGTLTLSGLLGSAVAIATAMFLARRAVPVETVDEVHGREYRGTPRTVGVDRGFDRHVSSMRRVHPSHVTVASGRERLDDFRV